MKHRVLRRIRFCVRAATANEPIKATAPPIPQRNPLHDVLKLRRAQQRTDLIRECKYLLNEINSIALEIIEPLVDLNVTASQPYIEILQRRDELAAMRERFSKAQRDQEEARQHYALMRDIIGNSWKRHLLPKRPDFASQRRVRRTVRYDAAAE
jgi:hypothetical protein